MKWILAAALAVFGAGAVNATSMTVGFDGFNDHNFTYQTSAVYGPGTAIHLHDDGGILQSTIARSRGGNFSAMRVDVASASYIYQSGAGAPPASWSPSFDPWAHASRYSGTMFNLLGYRNGTVVAQHAMSSTAWSVQTLNLGKSFHNIDALVAQTILPAGVQSYMSSGPSSSGALWCAAWCSDFVIDNLVVSVVPLPLPAVMLGSGMVALLVFGRRRV